MPGDRPIKKSTSEAQRRFMGAEYGRAKRGEPTETGISKAELRVKAQKPKGKRLPERAAKRR
jgi:hypothetical protein